MDSLISQVNLDIAVKAQETAKTVTVSITSTSPSISVGKTSMTTSTPKKTGDKKQIMNCVMNCARIEKDVGVKEKSLREMRNEMVEIVSKKEQLGTAIESLTETILEKEKKYPEYTMKEFREVCLLKNELADKINQKAKYSKRCAELTRQSKVLQTQVYQAGQQFKMFAYEKEKLLSGAK